MPRPLSDSLHGFPDLSRSECPPADTAFSHASPDSPSRDAGFPDCPPNTPPATTRVLRLADRDATLRRATGSDDARVHGWLVNDVAGALALPPALDTAAREDRVCAAVSAMCAIAPRDAIEGMLAAQMVAVHSAALDCLRRAAEPVAADRARDADLRHAGRLLNVFQRQMRVRDDRRNPLLAHGLAGRHAPDAPGQSPGVPVAPLRDPDVDAAPVGAPDVCAAPDTGETP